MIAPNHFVTFIILSPNICTRFAFHVNEKKTNGNSNFGKAKHCRLSQKGKLLNCNLDQQTARRRR